MPGVRHADFRKGDHAERFVEFVLGAFAFTTSILRQDDTGHDFYCVLIDPKSEGKLLVAGLPFLVQAKSNRQPIVYEKPLEQEWIASQENPLFVCIADMDSARVDVYSTWKLLDGLLSWGKSRTVLVPDKNGHPSKDDDTLTIPLSTPVLSLGIKESTDPELIARSRQIMDQWVRIDRQNIINRWTGFHWIAGVDEFETNSPLTESTPITEKVYWNPKNLETSARLFLRAATVLRLETERFIAAGGGVADAKISALEEALEGFWTELGPMARQILRDQIRRSWPDEPGSVPELLEALIDCLPAKEEQTAE